MNGGESVKTLTLSVALTTAAVALAPVARAEMQIGNYALQTNRDPGHAWIWEVRPCGSPGCVHVQAVPQPNGQAAPYDGNAQLANGRYTMTVDIPDGVRCLVYFLPSHDTYSWDAVTLAGSVVSTFDAGCGGAPGGTNTYTFQLVRW
ncbi:MAG TPA: hypothetical protein VEF72_32540 [Mycobacterium sp.]|nr:hypothetical protein [Mycobacterium sp.]